MNTTRKEKAIKELFLGECWEYLRNNFHKFNETNKIKIALTLATKDIPQEVNGGETRVIIMQPIQKDDEVLSYKIGRPDVTEAIRHSEETSAPNNGI